MSNCRSTIEIAKTRLPLPELLRVLGFKPPRNGEGNMPSPFAIDRRQKSPSFSIFRCGDAHGWCDRTGGQEIKGDEITLLERLENPEEIQQLQDLRREALERMEKVALPLPDR